MKTITINIEQKHIKKGRKSDVNYCPIAMALREQFNLGKDMDAVSVNDDEITIYKSNGFFFRFTWDTLPKIAESFINKFDGGKKVKPFKFKLPFINTK